MAKGTRRRTKETASSRGEYLYGKGPVKAAQIRILRSMTRDKKIAARLKSYSLPEDAEEAVDLLIESAKLKQQACVLLDKVPSDWRPLRGTIGATPLEVGQHVVLKNAVASRYDGMFDVARELVVVQVIGSKIVGETRDATGGKIRVPMPRAHVQVRR